MPAQSRPKIANSEIRRFTISSWILSGYSNYVKMKVSDRLAIC
jgi:hypothetical protein